MLNIFLFTINKIVEEDINELEDEPNKKDQSNVEDKDQKESDKKEENPEVNRGLKEINRCMEDDTSVLAATSKPNVGRFSMSQRTSRNEVSYIPRIFLNMEKNYYKKTLYIYIYIACNDTLQLLPLS